MERVSVVMPTRDRAGFAELAAEATLRQQDVEIELVVVDDGSTDGTSERLAVLGDARVVVVRHETSRGVAAARNTGVAHASGEWVAFRDDDDVWAPTKLAEQLRAASEAQATWVYCGYVPVDPSLSVLDEPWIAAPSDRILHELRRTCCISSGSIVLARKATIVELGGFDESIGIVEDWDMWLRLAIHEPGASVPQPLVGYVRQPGSIQIRNVDGLIPAFAKLRRKHEAAGVPLDASAFVQWIPSMYRKAGRRRKAAELYLRSAWTLMRPTDVARAVAVLGGEDVWERIRSFRGRAAEPLDQGDVPEWLTALREEVGQRLANVAE